MNTGHFEKRQVSFITQNCQFETVRILKRLSLLRCGTLPVALLVCSIEGPQCSPCEWPTQPDYGTGCRGGRVLCQVWWLWRQQVHFPGAQLVCQIVASPSWGHVGRRAALKGTWESGSSLTKPTTDHRSPTTSGHTETLQPGQTLAFKLPFWE